MMAARIFVGLFIVTALLAGLRAIYTAGSMAGAATVKQQWDRDTASRAMRTAEQNIQHRNTERALVDNAAQQQKAKNEAEKHIAAQHAAELDSLRNRPEQRAADRPGDPASPTPGGVGCTGAGLAGPDAAFLVGYAADAARLAADYKRCTALYDAAHRAVTGGAGLRQTGPQNIPENISDER